MDQVIRIGKKLCTKNIAPGIRQFSEELITKDGIEYRVWDPNHSKAAAALAKGLKHFPIVPGTKILYLGIANGNTASFFSDIVGPEGVIYGVEISERSIRDLTALAEKRTNIVPILANAKLPETYGWVEQVDVVFQDVAADDQSEILIKNVEKFLKPKGYALLSLKARSIDVTAKPQDVYKREVEKLKERLRVLEKMELDPYEKDHLFVVMQKS